MTIRDFRYHTKTFPDMNFLTIHSLIRMSYNRLPCSSSRPIARVVQSRHNGSHVYTVTFVALVRIYNNTRLIRDVISITITYKHDRRRILCQILIAAPPSLPLQVGNN